MMRLILVFIWLLFCGAYNIRQKNLHGKNCSEDQTIDFTHLLKVLRNTTSYDADAKYEKHCRPLKVSYPQSSVIITYINHPDFQMVELQHDALNLWTPGLRECIDARFVIANVDRKAYTQCLASGYYNCALVEIPGLDAFSTQFSCGFYAFSFFKYELIKKALEVVNEVFFFDADVLLFKSPWVDDNGLYRIGHHRSPPPYDFMFQRITGLNLTCEANDFNGGQYYFQNSTATNHFLDKMFSFRHEILNFSTGKFDQDYVKDAVIATPNMKVCGLRPSWFTSGRHVYGDNTTSQVMGKDIISYHFPSLDGPAKIYRMKTLIERMRASPEAVLANYFTRQHYFSRNVTDV